MKQSATIKNNAKEILPFIFLVLLGDRHAMPCRLVDVFVGVDAHFASERPQGIEPVRAPLHALETSLGALDVRI